MALPGNIITIPDQALETALRDVPARKIACFFDRVWPGDQALLVNSGRPIGTVEIATVGVCPECGKWRVEWLITSFRPLN